MATPPVFSAGAVLTAAQMNAVGLWLIDEVSLTTITNNISNVFSSDFDNYRIVMSGLNNASTTTRQISIRLRTSSDDTSANYYGQIQFAYGAAIGGIVSQNATTSAELFSMSQSTPAGNSATFDICGPETATLTTWYGQRWAYQANVATFVAGTFWGCMNTSTQYTGFSIIGNTDNLSGTVRVYGYRK
jgi:hypothetical protein